jgi:16S rRNA processing protein RimM
MADEWIVMGRIGGLFGVKGWVKLLSYTEPRTALFDYQPLYLAEDSDWRRIELEQGRAHGKGLIAKFIGVDDRDAAAALTGREIAIRREQLPPPAPGEYYWADLEGLRVVTVDGIELGRVDHLFSTGANDVLVVRGERERLIPFLRDQVIRGVDLDGGTLQVDWDPAF